MDEETFRLRLAAGEFCKAGQRCGTPGEDWLSKPEVVNYSFAAELGLKALIRLHTGKAAKGHNLLQLYQALPPEVALKLRKGANVVIFEEKIGQIANAFVEWRYAFEKEFLVVSISSLKELAEATIELFDSAGETTQEPGT